MKKPIETMKLIKTNLGGCCRKCGWFDFTHCSAYGGYYCDKCNTKYETLESEEE